MPEPEEEGGAPDPKPARSLNWRAVGMTTGVVLVTLMAVLAFPLLRARFTSPTETK